MLGLMQDQPLLISQIITHAARHHATAEVVSKTVEGGIHRTTYADLERRARRLARVLQRLDVDAGDRVATLAWNGYRHLELYYGVSGMQAVCHTVNPRLSPDDIAFILNDAGDVLLFAETSFVALVEAVAPRLAGQLRAVVLHGRPRPHAGPRAAARHGAAVLRGADGGGRRGLCLARLRRTHRRLALLHLGHHRAAEGRAVQPPLDPAACLCDQHARRDGPALGRPVPAGGADVPCQCLGHCPMRRRWPARRWSCRGGIWTARPRRADERGAGDHGGRRADRLARPAAASARQWPAAGHGAALHDRRLGLPAHAVRGVRRRIRRAHLARLGHDRNVAGRHLQHAQGEQRPPRPARPKWRCG